MNWKLAKDQKPENDKFFGPKNIVLVCTSKREIFFATYDPETDTWANTESHKVIEGVTHWDYITFPK